MKRSILHCLMLVLHGKSHVSGAGIESLPALGVIGLPSRLEHVQGIDVEGTRVWVSSVDRPRQEGRLRVFDFSSRTLLREAMVAEGERYHPGGVALDGRWIWVPVAEYRPSSTTVIQRRNRETLALEASFEVADHIGCLAVVDGVLVGGNWDSRVFYRWTREGRELGRVENRTGVAFQDLKPYGKGRLIGGGIADKREGAVAIFDAKSGETVHRWSAGRTDRGTLLTQEGLALRRGRLYLLPEDGESRLFIYRWRKPRR